ncbi:OmpA family protein [Celeribacter sp.]|uniref:OmpA family protein n=1 Tax=Celeribacter sp. TaxID=1890673 RepID=UPI003A9231D6
MAATFVRKVSADPMLPRVFSLTIAALVVFAIPMAALDLPSNAIATEHDETVREITFPTRSLANGVVVDDTVMLAQSGTVTRRAWSVPSSITSFQLIDPLRAQIEADGFEVLFACADTVCGGFAFRFELDLLPPPHMFVDLGDFQYLVARDDEGHVASIVTSRTRNAGFIHLSEVVPRGVPTIDITAAPAPETAPEPGGLPEADAGSEETIVSALITHGHVSLDDLAFETGASTLGAGPFSSLRALADFLTQTPDARIVLVGHTDNVGALESNIALSRRRAEAVRDRLVSNYGVSPSQISADGVGYLAPRVSNDSDGGRDKNRRVEAVLASTREN